MKILITGAKGMIGSALATSLKNIKNEKISERSNLQIEEIYEYDINNSDEELEMICEQADVVFNFAGINRTKDSSEFIEGNYGFVVRLLKKIKKNNNKVKVMQASSIQASLEGRFKNSDYGKSKLVAEKEFFDFEENGNGKVAVYRLPNMMGHSKPNYNSVISTLCNAFANDLEYHINDTSIELDVLYIDDFIEAMLDFLEGKENRCEYNGLTRVDNPNGRFCYVPGEYKVSLGEIEKLLKQFKEQPNTLMMPKIPENSFAKKLYSLYLTYLPVSRFKFPLKTHADKRGGFTELLHTFECGQVSVNISEPGIIKGQHWHSSKWELFIVVSGHALIQERNVSTGERVEFEVSGDKIEAVYMIPGWTHNIINLSETEKLVTIIICNENYNPQKQDTILEIV